MSQTPKSVIVIGGGGNLGPSILTALTNELQFNVSVLSRSNSTSVFPANVRVVKISENYPENELLEAFAGQDAVVSTITHNSLTDQIRIIDAAVKAGVKRFVPSDFGGSMSETALQLAPFMNDKIAVQNHLNRSNQQPFLGPPQQSAHFLIGKPSHL